MAAPSKNFTVIADGAIDADSPITADLMTDFRDNDIHLEEWLGKNYTAAVDHDHDGVNSALVDVAAAMSVYVGRLTTAGGAGWSVSTGALGFDPVAMWITWEGDETASGAFAYGWGYASGTSSQVGMAYTPAAWATASGIGWCSDVNDIMGISAGGGASRTSFALEQARVTAFAAANVTIATQSGSWQTNAIYIIMLILGG